MSEGTSTSCQQDSIKVIELSTKDKEYLQNIKKE